MRAAGSRAAPDAVQIADRFHLLQNLSDALEHDIQRLQIEARRPGLISADPVSEKPKRLTLIEARLQRCRQARYERYRTVLDLTAKGYTQLAIAARIGIDPETISRWTKAPCSATLEVPCHGEILDADQLLVSQKAFEERSAL